MHAAERAHRLSDVEGYNCAVYTVVPRGACKDNGEKGELQRFFENKNKNKFSQNNMDRGQGNGTVIIPFKIREIGFKSLSLATMAIAMKPH